MSNENENAHWWWRIAMIALAIVVPVITLFGVVWLTPVGGESRLGDSISIGLGTFAAGWSVPLIVLALKVSERPNRQLLTRLYATTAAIFIPTSMFVALLNYSLEPSWSMFWSLIICLGAGRVWVWLMRDTLNLSAK